MTSECTSCHLPDYLATHHPPHPGVRPTTCAVCHTQASWSPSVLNHTWPLTGKHLKATCFQCHHAAGGGDAGEPVFRGTSKLCVGCHRADYDRAKTFPEHDTFALTCEECHTTAAWEPSTWTSDDGGAFDPAAWARAHEPALAPAKEADAGASKPGAPRPKPVPPQPHPHPTAPPAPTSAHDAGPPDIVSRPSRRH